MAVTDPTPEQNEPPWLEIAKRELGVREVPGERSNHEITKYYKATSLGGNPGDDVPWCSAFCCWVMERAGYRSTRRANARSWSVWGDPLEQPKRGAVCVFWRGSADSHQGHVGFYVGSPRANVLSVLSGNQGNAVSIKDYGTGRLLSVRWPRDIDRIHST